MTHAAPNTADPTQAHATQDDAGQHDGEPTTGYTMGVTVDLPYRAAVAATRAALADAGFGVLTEIDLRATMKDKLGVDGPPHLILGACRPQLAHEALAAEPSVAALLPCNVVVRGLGDGRSRVEAVDPHAMLQLAGSGVDSVATEAHARLSRALSGLLANTRPVR